MYDVAKQAGVDVTFVEVEGGAHGFGTPEVNVRVKAFLDKQLRQKRCRFR